MTDPRHFSMLGARALAGALALSLAASGCLAAPGQGRGGRRGGGPPPPPGNRAYDMAQTLSDRAQLHTLAFSAFAFLTGSLGADSFFPPGKVADWWGFQYLRDNDPSRLGHNTDFLTKAAYNMLYVLTDEQRARLLDLAQRQVQPIGDYALRRFPLMQAFRRQLTGDLPAGSQGLDKAAVLAYSGDLYRLDGEMSLQRAEVMGGLLHELTPQQRAYLDRLTGTGMATWPNLPEPIDRRSLPHDVHVAVMTYAADMLSWYVGSVEADVYFCPERQGTYFGGFYLKDAPAMGNPNCTISDRLTGDMGETMMSLLSPAQGEALSSLVPAQLPLLQEIVNLRRRIATQLRRSMAGESADRAAVLALSEQYGRLDGQIAFGDAVAFAQVGRSLTPQQRADLAALRRQMSVGVPQGAFLYSTPIRMPALPNTDFLFGAKR